MKVPLGGEHLADACSDQRVATRAGAAVVRAGLQRDVGGGTLHWMALGSSFTPVVQAQAATLLVASHPSFQSAIRKVPRTMPVVNRIYCTVCTFKGVRYVQHSQLWA